MVQVVSPVQFSATGVDVSPLASGLGSFVSQKINERLQKKALEGDNQALTRLTSRDPRGAARVGDILQTEQSRADAIRQQEQALLPRIARGFQASTDKAGFLQQTSEILRSQGFDRMADDVAEDAVMFASDPESVNLEYEAGLAMFTDPERAQQLTAAIQDREDLINNLVGAKKPRNRPAIYPRRGGAGFSS